jgi:hypothetical protein
MPSSGRPAATRRARRSDAYSSAADPRHAGARGQVEEAVADAHLVLRARRIPERDRGVGECPRALVAVVVGQVSAAAEVRPEERTVARHQVPAGTPVRDRIERRELAGELDRLVEGRAEGRDQADVRRLPCDLGELHQRVGTTHHVEIVDLPRVLAQSQPLREEHEVHQAPLGALGESRERGRLDLTPRLRAAPDRRLVDTGEVRTEVHSALRHRGFSFA